MVCFDKVHCILYIIGLFNCFDYIFKMSPFQDFFMWSKIALNFFYDRDALLYK